MAYPGETVSWDTSSGVTAWYGNSSGNIWIEGLSVGDITAAGDERAFSWDAGIDDIMFFENSFAQQTTGGVTSHNGGLMMSRANDGATGQRLSIMRNAFLGTNGRDILLGYGTRKVVIEANSISNNIGSNSHGFYAKIDNQQWSIRANTSGTGNTSELADIDNYDPGVDEIEVAWNYYRTTGVGLHVGPNNGDTAVFGTLSDYRNTWIGDYNLAETIPAGSWNATRNVVVHDGTYTQGYGRAASLLTITRTGICASDSSDSCDGNVDSNGLLTGADRTNYLGIRGHEVH
jgi:hypothetical protein